MSYREIGIGADSSESAATEIMFNIAACRVDGVDLIRIDLPIVEEGKISRDGKKMLFSITRLLKDMKQKGSIQFFATEDSFARSTTEAVYLQNKYPALFSSIPERVSDQVFIFIKL